MAKVVIPVYPEALTVKFWDKAKGLLARIKKVETGITAELKAARAVFDKAPWGDLNATDFLTKYSKGQGSKTAAYYDDMLRLYVDKNLPPFTKLEKTFADLSVTLSQKANKLAEDDETKGFSPAVKKMADAAKTFTSAVEFQTVTSANRLEFAKLQEVAAKNELQWASVREMIDRAGVAIDKAAKKTPTASDYDSMWSRLLRFIGADVATALETDPTMKDLFADPLTLARKHWTEASLPKHDKDVAAFVKKDVELIKKFKVAAGGL